MVISRTLSNQPSTCRLVQASTSNMKSIPPTLCYTCNHENNDETSILLSSTATRKDKITQQDHPVRATRCPPAQSAQQSMRWLL
jgi:hypothetical protein